MHVMSVDGRRVFRDQQHLYKIFGSLFERARDDPSLSRSLSQSNLVVRFIYKEPSAEITVDLRDSVHITLGPSDMRPDVEFIQSGDTAHQFWLGRLPIVKAIATRKVIARGSVPKALALLPLIKPLFSLYPRVLHDIGEGKLLPSPKTIRSHKKGSFLRNLFPRKKKSNASPIHRYAMSPIPLVDEEPHEATLWSPSALPEDERSLKIEMLCRMVLIRAFEERLAREFSSGAIPSEALFLSVGQESCAVGASFALRNMDYLATTHRCIGHSIARGSDLKRIAAEIFGKEEGLCKGLGGSMHLADASLGLLGGNGIVGASSLLAIGAALSIKARGTDQVALAFVGDGATAQGMFHEALNLAAVLNLPVIFFIENNQYAGFTPLRGHTRLKTLSDRAKAHGIPGITIDGNDVWGIYMTVREMARRVREGEGPLLIEAVTYRQCGHTEGESAIYRTEEEKEYWKRRDPIEIWRERLHREEIIQESFMKEMEEGVRRDTEEAVSFALSAKEPSPEVMAENLYSPEPRYLYTRTEALQTPREITTAAALGEALAEEMGRDERVYLIGEDVRTGGYFGVTSGLVERFGPGRVIDTPISEYAIVGSSVGAAMTGMRPIAEIQFSDFITCCMDPLVNQAAKLRSMSGGQFRIPLVVRTPGGAGIGMASQHSQSFESWLLHIPGLIIVAPGDPHSAKGLLKAAIRSHNPVVFFENKLLYGGIGPIPEGEYIVPLGKAIVRMRGSDITVVAAGAMVPLALEAADMLKEEVSVEVIDPCTLSPCDWKTIAGSVRKTGRLLIVESGALTCGFGAECAARISEIAWGTLKGPVKRIAALEYPIPYNYTLENIVIPDVERITDGILSLMS